MNVNDLMRLAAEGDQAAINVLDMIDADECGARTANGKQLQEWYECNGNRKYRLEGVAV